MIEIEKLPILSLKEALTQAYNKRFQLTGRARRSEFWWCFLVASAIGVLTGWIPYAGPLVLIALTLSMVPLTVRRLHDAEHSAWWLGYGLILIGIGFFVFLMCAINIPSFWDAMFSEKAIQKYSKELHENYFYKLLAVVFFFYLIIIFCFMLQKGTIGENEFGKSPKYNIYEVEDE